MRYFEECATCCSDKTLGFAPSFLARTAEARLVDESNADALPADDHGWAVSTFTAVIQEGTRGRVCVCFAGGFAAGANAAGLASRWLDPQEHDGTATVLADSYNGKKLDDPNLLPRLVAGTNVIAVAATMPRFGSEPPPRNCPVPSGTVRPGPTTASTRSMWSTARATRSRMSTRIVVG